MIEILRNTRFLFDVNNVVMIEILRNTRIFLLESQEFQNPSPFPGLFSLSPPPLLIYFLFKAHPGVIVKCTQHLANSIQQ
jgi:hypothetical protein